MASLTRLSTGDLSVPPSPNNLKDIFSPHTSNKSDDGMDSDEDEQSLNMKERTFKDSVHGLITLSDKVCKVIDTPQFQRLRHVKQLGTSYYVWPAASHNRFEHCLGVAHLAATQITRLQQRQPKLGITQQDIDCVTIAGLCHDLGHGPWSHVWDSLFIPKAIPHKKWKHEDASEMMFDALCQEPGVDIAEEEAHIVKALIAGDATRCPELAKKKAFLFEIVANKRNGLDVDKFDYIARDSLGIGQGEMIALMKLIQSARVIEGQVCYDIKDANSVYELYWTRFSLHKRIYNHKTAKAIEHMIVDALLAAEPYLNIANQIEDPKRYLYLTDDIKLRVQATTEPELEKARQIFARIDSRKLYKCVEYKVYPWSVRDICRNITPKKIVDAAKRTVKETDKDYELACELKEEHIIVDFAEMHYGMKEHNPLKFVKFYSKRKPKVARHAENGDISNIMPEAFAEILLRIYARDPRLQPAIERGYGKVLEDIVESAKADAISLSDDEGDEGEGTPRAHPADDPSGLGVPKRTMSRVPSLRLAPDADGDAPVTTPFTRNKFMDSGPDAEPSGSRKRAADERSPSPAGKRGRIAKE